ncbi:MAG: HEAT repeat domain-containing protein [Methanomicrobiales archaeon]|nr:HEAT repeat domain-containing protein [Methanomicrobiales archaeon]
MKKRDIDAMRRARDIDGLIRALEDPDGAMRLNAAKALGSAGDEKAMEPLERLKFSDPDLHVRRAASLAHTRVAERVAAKKAIEGMRLER